MRFDYRRLRREWDKYREGIPFESLIKDASLEVLELFERFSDVYVTFDVLNDSEKLDYIERAKLSVWPDEKFEEHGFRYLISVDIGNFEYGFWIRRSILHELWHIVQFEHGHDITSANVTADGFTQYFADPLEREAIEHEVLSAWF